MTKRLLPLVSLVLAFSAAAFAQSTANPDNTSAQAAKTTESSAEPVTSPTPSIPIEPPSILPPNSLPGPNSGALPQLPIGPDLELLKALFKQTTLGKTADDHLLHVQMAELKAQIRNDADLHQLKHEAERARTDLEKRHILKSYYHLYYEKLRARAKTPELKTYLTAQEDLRQFSLLQPRVRHETDEAPAAALTKALDDAAASTAAATPGAATTLPTPTPPTAYDEPPAP